MNKNQKLSAGIFVLLAGLYVVNSWISSSALSNVLVAAILVAVVWFAGQLWKNMKLSEKIKEVSSNNSKNSYSYEECKQIAKDWSKKEYDGRIKSQKGISFDWTQAKHDLTQVFNFRQQEWIDVRYFYSQYGPKNKGALIFVDASNGGVLSHTPVKKHNLKDNPFQHLSMYRMTMKYRHRINQMENNDNQNIQSIQGIPVNVNGAAAEESED